MNQIQKFLVFILICAFSLTWNAIGGACAPTPSPAPNPSPTPSPSPTPNSTPSPTPSPAPSQYFEPSEEFAIYNMLQDWNDSGTNSSALMPSWSSNRTHPCNYTFPNGTRTWFLCSHDNVSIGNLSGIDNKLYNMNILFGDNIRGDVELVGQLPPSIRNLTNLRYLRMNGHPRLSGPLPSGMLKAFPSITSLSLTNSNLSGIIAVPPTPFKDIDELDLSGNAFTGTPFCQDLSANFTVRSLNFSTNKFSGTFCGDDSSTKLEVLDISGNQFTDVNISLLGQTGNASFPLKVIYGQNNSLQSFPNQLLQLPRLEEIYFDSNNISGVLAFPIVSTTTSLLRLLSLVNNNIAELKPSTDSSSLFSESSLRISDLVFLGGNPVCKDSRRSDLLRMVCRFNKSSPMEDLYDEDDNKTAIIISSCIGSVVLVALIVTLFFVIQLRRKIAIISAFQNELVKKDIKPNLYSYSELKAATQDFHSNNELGRGGFGVVYKGVLMDGTKVAVKRLLKAKKEREIQDFLNEIIVISNIKHRNLVQLKGCCIREGQRILVYELFENKNLASTLWGDPNEKRLDWGSRFNIILGIARGLAYTHEEIEPPIIHRDIKGPNILLDKDLNPKIADFGLALLLPSLDDGETHMKISRVAGTMGYLAPEYVTYGQVSTKVDVYSFGVLILEIISGRKNIDNNFPVDKLCLTLWAQRLYAKNQVMELVDKSLQELTKNEDATIKRVIEIGLLCLHHAAARRPSMSDIVAMLIGNNEINIEGLYQYLQTYIQESDSSYTQESESSSSFLPSIDSHTISQA